MPFWDRLPRDRLLIDASLWSADLTALRDDIHRIDPFVDLYHFDVSDDHFVPGLLFFPDLVAGLRPLTSRPFHVHLMTDHPERLVESFLGAGADLVTVHLENGSLAQEAMDIVRRAGKGAGIVLKLETPIEAIAPYLGSIDLALLMGTRLGVKGQDLAPEACDRITRMRRMIDQNGLTDRVKLFTDGGIRRHTVPGLRRAGADGIVPGSLVFGSPDLAETIAWLHGLPGANPS